jgi:hypothetical protein
MAISGAFNKRFCWPESLLKLLATYHFAWVFKQHRQDLDRLLLKPNSEAVLA